MIRWIFFDFGNVLFIDEPLLEHTWEEIYRTIRDCTSRVCSGFHPGAADIQRKRSSLMSR